MSLGTLFVIALLAAVAWLAFKGKFASSGGQSAGSDPVGNIAGPGLYEIEVVGESHYQRALEALCGGRTSDSADKKVQAHLVLEDDNKYDPQAVRVDIEGKTVGYLSRETAREYRTRLRQTGHPRLVGVCKATIRGGWDRGAKD